MKKLAMISMLVLFGASSAVAQPDFDNVEVKVHPVAGSVYYLEGAGGNIGVFIGDDGVFLIDDQYAPLTEKIVAAIRTLSDEPIRFLINTHMHPDHTGGNENFGKIGTMIYGHDKRALANGQGRIHADAAVHYLRRGHVLPHQWRQSLRVQDARCPYQRRCVYPLRKHQHHPYRRRLSNHELSLYRHDERGELSRDDQSLTIY